LQRIILIFSNIYIRIIVVGEPHSADENPGELELGFELFISLTGLNVVRCGHLESGPRPTEPFIQRSGEKLMEAKITSEITINIEVLEPL